MTDYYPLIARAVLRLADPTAQARREVYDRAEKALVVQLRNGSLPETLISEEIVSLREAAARLEQETGSAAAASLSGSKRGRFHPSRWAEHSQSLWAVVGATAFGLVLIGFTAWSLNQQVTPTVAASALGPAAVGATSHRAV